MATRVTGGEDELECPIPPSLGLHSSFLSSSCEPTTDTIESPSAASSAPSRPSSPDTTLPAPLVDTFDDLKAKLATMLEEADVQEGNLDRLLAETEENMATFEKSGRDKTMAARHHRELLENLKAPMHLRTCPHAHTRTHTHTHTNTHTHMPPNNVAHIQSQRMYRLMYR